MIAGLKLQYGTDFFNVTDFTCERNNPQHPVKLVKYVGMNPERPNQCAYLPLAQCTENSLDASFRLIYNNQPVRAVSRESHNHYRIFTAYHPNGTVINTSPPALALPDVLLLIANLHAIGHQPPAGIDKSCQGS